MPAADPFKFPKRRRRLDNMRTALKEQQKRPYVGITQGGSSRQNQPAKVAATDPDFYRKTRRKKDG